LHFGGESLLHPNFKEFLEYAIHQRNLGKIGRVCWVDNGMLFDKKIADLVISSKVDLLSFSLDGVRQVNDKIRLGSDYSAIEKNIKYLLDKRGAEDKPEIRLSMCDYGKNEEEELEVYREWAPFVDGITLIPSIRFDNTIENKEGLQRLETLGPPPFCIFPFDTLAIGWDGKVTGCCLDYVFKMVLGDATKESIKEIWRGRKFQALRKAALTNSFPFNSPCSKCEFWKLNFQSRQELILNGKAKIEYSYIYRKIKKV
jgi:radical SAM protein with 4Fe4S-binding SPASM domain